MNGKRRKEIDKIVSKAEELQVELQYVLEEEQDAYDNTPESLQGTDRYSESEEALQALEDADGALQEFIDYLSELL